MKIQFCSLRRLGPLRTLLGTAQAPTSLGRQAARTVTQRTATAFHKVPTLVFRSTRLATRDAVEPGSALWAPLAIGRHTAGTMISNAAEALHKVPEFVFYIARPAAADAVEHSLLALPTLFPRSCDTRATLRPRIRLLVGFQETVVAHKPPAARAHLRSWLSTVLTGQVFLGGFLVRRRLPLSVTTDSYDHLNFM